MCENEKSFGTTAVLKRNGDIGRSSERNVSRGSSLAKTKQLIEEIGHRNPVFSGIAQSGLADAEVGKTNFFKEKIRPKKPVKVCEEFVGDKEDRNFS